MQKKERPVTVFKLEDHFTCLQKSLHTLIELGDENSDEAGLEDGAHNMFLVQGIKGRRELNGQVEYLVKWAGWKDAANTWEPEETLNSVRKEIDKFNHGQSIYSSSQSSLSQYEVTISPNKWKSEEESKEEDKCEVFSDFVKPEIGQMREEYNEHRNLIEEDLSDYFERTEGLISQE